MKKPDHETSNTLPCYKRPREEQEFSDEFDTVLLAIGRTGEVARIKNRV